MFVCTPCQYDFTQIIDSPTHNYGHILHVLYIMDYFSQAVYPKVVWGPTNHLATTFSVDIPIKAPCKFRQVNEWKIHRIDIINFREDILNSDLIKHPHKTASLISHQYFNTLQNILDMHATVNRKNHYFTLTKAS